MIIIQSYTIAVIMLFFVLLAWGSWPNTMKFTPKDWKFQLFYWDFGLGMLLFSLALAFTMGSTGSEGRSFMEDLKQADLKFLWLAFLGGVIYNFYNILLISGVSMAGIAVAFPIGVGMALVFGTIANYVVNPVGNLFILLIGLLAVIVAIILVSLAYKKLTANTQKTPFKVILMLFIGGIAGTFWFMLVAKSMSTNQANLELGKLGPYSSVVLFALGIVISNFIFNTFLMKRPLEGEPVPFSDYLKKGSVKTHSLGILGGVTVCFGMNFSILASGVAGFAISYGLAQTCTMVAALWGIFVWKEFNNAPQGTNKYLVFMFLFYIIGISMLILSRNY